MVFRSVRPEVDASVQATTGNASFKPSVGGVTLTPVGCSLRPLVQLYRISRYPINPRRSLLRGHRRCCSHCLSKKCSLIPSLSRTVTTWVMPMDADMYWQVSSAFRCIMLSSTKQGERTWIQLVSGGDQRREDPTHALAVHWALLPLLQILDVPDSSG
ncbi:hypothetical protein MRX96_016085 [Rhipicephalus microplus]